MLALRVKDKTGEGQRIDISMLEGQLSLLGTSFFNYFASGKVPKPMGNAYAVVVPYQTFRTKTKDLAIAIAGDAPAATPRGSTRRRSPARSRTSPASTIPTRRRRSPRSWSRPTRRRQGESLAKILAKLEELGLRPSRREAAAVERRARKQLIAPARRRARRSLFARRRRGKRGRKGEVARAGDARRAREAADLEMHRRRRVLPLKGFMTSKDYLRVVERDAPRERPRWSVPITLAVSPDEAERSASVPRSRSRMPDGRIVAVLERRATSSCPDKELEAREVYRTTEDEHPGVAYLKASGDVYLGGEIRSFERRRRPEFPEYRRDPAQTRAALRRARLERRSSASRRATRSTAPTSTSPNARWRSVDGLLLHPLVGETKSDDIPADVRMECYEVLLENYYPKDRVLLSVYPARCATPARARRSSTRWCARTTAARTSSSAATTPASATTTAPTTRSTSSTSSTPDELGITPLIFEHTLLLPRLRGDGAAQDLPARHRRPRVTLSGTQVREMLAAGELPPRSSSARKSPRS